jgi:beta-mannanase
MKRRQVLVNLLAAAAAPAALSATGWLGSVRDLFAQGAAPGHTGKYPLVHRPGLDFGVYDPHGDFRHSPSVSIEHVYLPWQDVALASLGTADAYAVTRGRSLLITIEPWSWSDNSSSMPDQLRAGLLSGHYDENIRSIAAAIGQLKSPTTIRWAQEMEETGGRYAWSGWEPADYVAAYRRFYDVSKPLVPHAVYMWSPRGEESLVAYYPGDAYADTIGLSVFGFQKYDQLKFGWDRDFSDILRPRYDRVARFRKPVHVAELGYDGDDQYVARWAAAVTKPVAGCPLLRSIVYFDDLERYPWPDDCGYPDWRVA